MKRVLPLLIWLPGYQRAWLRPDLIAGLTLWAVSVPEAMAYAGIAGVPPAAGLYAIPLPLLAYAVFGGSRNLVVGPDSATALISFSTIGGLVAQRSADFTALTSTLAVVVGIFFLGLGLLRVGWLARFVSTPVMKGFVQGLVWVTIAGQLPKLLGIAGGPGPFFPQLWTIGERLPDCSASTVAVGLASLLALALVRRRMPRVPAALTIALIAILASTAFHLERHGVAVVGDLPSALPELAMPRLDLPTLRELIPGALAIVLLGYAESLAAAKAAPRQPGGDVDADRELLALGPANVLSGLSGGFVTVGSLSKTSVVIAAGARSQLAGVVAALLILPTLLYLTPAFHALPEATLAAVVIEAMLALVDIAYLRRLWAISRREFCWAMAAFAGELVLGVLPGIALGVASSLLMLTYRATRPNTAVLGKLPGQDAYRVAGHHPEAETFPGLLIFRFSADIFFANADYFVETLRAAIAGQSEPVLCVLVDAESVNFIDTSALDALAGLVRSLAEQGIAVGIARARGSIRHPMERHGLADLIGRERFFDRITDGVHAWTTGNDMHRPPPSSPAA